MGVSRISCFFFLLVFATTISLAQTCPTNLADLLDGGSWVNPGPGACTFAAGGSITITGDVNFTGDLTITTVGTLTITSNFTWVSGTFNIQGNSGNLLIGNGTTGSMTIQGGSVFANDNANGTLTINSNSSLTINSGASIQDHGTITINSGATLTNSGSVTNTTGTFSVAGTLTNNSGGQLSLGGVFSVPATGTASNSGTITTSGSNDNTVQGTLTTNGTMNLAGDLVVTGATGTVTMNGGSIAISRVPNDGDLEVTFGGHFTMNSGTLTVQDDVSTIDGGPGGTPGTNSYGYIVINGAVTIGEDLFITEDPMNSSNRGTLTGTALGGTIGIGDDFTDVSCPYPSGTISFCHCVDDNQGGAICNAQLPVELLTFDGVSDGNAIRLSWTTATETNNHFFTIEKLLPEDVFEQIGRIPGNGTTVVAQRYHAFDTSPDVGKNYYRLRQTDFDGRTSVFDLIRVDFNGPEPHLDLFPNPTSAGKCMVSLSGFVPGENVCIIVVTPTGKIVAELRTEIDISGSAQASMDLTNAASGVYFIRAKGLSKFLVIR